MRGSSLMLGLGGLSYGSLFLPVPGHQATGIGETVPKNSWMRRNLFGW